MAGFQDDSLDLGVLSESQIEMSVLLESYVELWARMSIWIVTQV